MDAEQESQAVRLFLVAAVVMLVAVLLELIWGAQWRWLVTTVIVGVAVAVAVPIADVVRTRPHGLLPPPVDVAPLGFVDAVAATQSEGERMAAVAQSVCEQAGLDWEDPETRRVAQRAITEAEKRVAPVRRPFPIPVQPINPPKWAPGQPRPVDEFFTDEVQESRLEPAPKPPRPFSPVADPPDATARFPRPDTR